jgi:hypothetical protein
MQVTLFFSSEHLHQTIISEYTGQKQTPKFQCYLSFILNRDLWHQRLQILKMAKLLNVQYILRVT